MKLLLGYYHTLGQGKGRDEYEFLLPIGICSLYAQLRSMGRNATLVNFCGMPQSEISMLLKTFQPDLVGLSQWTHNRHSTLELARLIKSVVPGCKVVLGGGHATSQAELILQRHPEIDLVVVGEAEETLVELVNTLECGGDLEGVAGLVIRRTGEVVRTKPRLQINSLDELVFPARWLHAAVNSDHAHQAEFFSSSRGCPAACRFCGSPVFWGRKVRFRSAESVVDEMQLLRQQYGLIYYSLRDDTFTADRKRVVALCKEMLEQRLGVFWSCQSRAEAIDAETVAWMRRAGCECIQLGVESGAPETLRFLGKQITPERVIAAADVIRQAGIHLSIYLIAGIPGETEQAQQQTLALVKKVRPDDIQAAPLAYYPGTALFEAEVQSGRLPRDLFEVVKNQAVLARKDGINQVDRLLQRCQPYYHHPTVRQLQRVQQQLGFSPVTAMQIGDILAAEGRAADAEQQYREIISQDPIHPWGWYLLAELLEQNGQWRAAGDCYRHVCTVVPKHQPSVEGVARCS